MNDKNLIVSTIVTLGRAALPVVPLRKLIPVLAAAAFLCAGESFTWAEPPLFYEARNYPDGSYVDPNPIGTRMPLILIHGMQSSPRMWGDFLTNGWGAKPTMKANFKPYVFSYHTEESRLSYGDPTSVAGLAQCLGKFLEAEYGKGPALGFNGRPFAIMAHSMGGLVARSMMQNYRFQDRSLGGDKTALLITLATPFHGSPAANQDYNYILHPIIDIWWNLQRDFAHDLSWDCYDYWKYGYCFIDPPSALYDSRTVAFAGTTANPSSDYEKAWWYLTHLAKDGLGYESDGVVPLGSALFDGRTLKKAPYRIDGDCDHSQIYDHSRTSGGTPIFDIIASELLSAASLDPIPVISSVSPANFTGIPLPQTTHFTISGSGFTSNSRLSFNDGTLDYSGLVPQFISPTLLAYDIKVGTQAATWKVKVVNGTFQSAPYPFHVLNGVDTTPPPAPSLTVSPSTTSRNNLFYLSWVDPVDPSGISRVWYKLGSPPASSGDGIPLDASLFNPLPVALTLSEGTQTAYVWLEDGAGNKSYLNQASVALTLDVTAPTIAITSPATSPTYTVSQNTVALAGNYADNLSGVVAITWVNDLGWAGSATTTGTPLAGTWNSGPISLSTGINNIAVVAVDAAGNVAVANIQVTYLNGSNTGTLDVTLNPADAVTAGAQWRIVGETLWRNSGPANNIPVGAQTIEFKPANGWITPLSVALTVSAGQTTSWTATYQPVVVNQPPSPASNPNPASGAVNVNRVNPVFTFSAGSPQNVPAFAFFLGTNPDPESNPVEVWGYGSVFGNRVQLSRTLLAATTYYWKIKTRDANSLLVTDGPVWSFTTEYAYADLVVTTLSFDGNVAPGSNVAVTASVKNAGTLPIAAAYLNVYLSRSPGAKEVQLNPRYVNILTSPLAPGDERQFSYQVTLNHLQAGQSFIDAWIDSSPSGAAAEDNYANNLKSLAINYIDGSPPTVTYVSLANPFVKTGVNDSIVYSATDDIGVQTLDFYYSFDGGLNWTPIQEGYVPPTPPEYGAVLLWTVPTNLPVGSNLTIRVVARDTSGNWGERIAGPYVVHDGTAPSVTVVSPNGGEIWDMGSQQQIKWNLSAANGVGRFNVYFYHDNTAEFLAVPVPSGNGTYNWTLPTPFSTTTGKVRIYVEDVNGNAAEDYSDGFFTIRDTSAPPPAPWTSPQIVTSNAANDPVGTPRVATDSAGNVHLVYGSRIDTGNNPEIITQTISYRKRVGGTWSAAQSVFTVTQQVDAGHPDYYGIGGEMRIAISPSGVPHVVWSTSHSGGLFGLNQNDIFYSTLDGANWTAPLNLSVDLPGFSGVATVSREPSIQVDPAGVVHVVWTDGWFFNSDNSRTGVPNIYYRKRDPVSGWGTPSKVTDSASYYPALASGSANILHLAFIGYPANASSILYMTNDGVSWSSPASAAAGADNAVDIMSDGNNHPHIVWRAFNATAGQDEVAYTYYDGTSWSSRQVLCSAGSVRQPAISSDTFGRPHVTWESLIAAGDFRYKLLYSFKDGSGWSPQIQLNLASQFVAEYSSDSAVSLANNEMHVVWVSNVGGGYQVLYNHANVGSTSDIFAPSVAVTAPVSSDVLPIGAIAPIRWTATDNIGVTAIHLHYSTNNGTSWTMIASNQPNNGMFNWAVPDLATNIAQVRVTAQDAAGNTNYGLSGGFTTADLTPPAITLVSPTNGAVLAGSSSVNVNWGATDNVAVTSIDLQYSLDNGNAWFGMATGLSNTGSYAWIVPNTPTTLLLIRATARDAAGLSTPVVSGQPLTILRGNTPPVTPHSPFPLNGATNVPIASASLLWSSGDLDGDALTYQLRFGTNANPPTVSFGTQAAFAPGLLEPQTLYRWQVLVSDGVTTNVGPVWTFTTAARQLTRPTIFGLQTAANGMLRLEFNGLLGATYNLEASTNLSDWTPLASLVGTNSVMFFSDTPATNAARFYRIRVE